jgi:hypothetical protein
VAIGGERCVEEVVAETVPVVGIITVCFFFFYFFLSGSRNHSFCFLLS